MKKLYHISHIDLDGVGCQILVDHYYRDSVYEVVYINANYDDIDDVISNVLDEANFDSGDRVLITDISSSHTSTNSRIDRINTRYLSTKPICLIDHHVSAERKLAGANWAHIDTSKSATLLTLEWLEAQHGRHDDYDALREFATLVNDYDMWIHADRRSRRLNKFFWSIGIEAFRKRFIEDVRPQENGYERYLIDVLEASDQEYIERAVSTARIISHEGYVCAHVYAERLAGDIAERILSENKLVDYVQICNAQGGRVSLRSRKGGTDVSDIAQSMGGGGHQSAAGFPANFNMTPRVKRSVN